MELPFDYIVLSMLDIQKAHNVKTEIDKKALIRYLIKIAKELKFNMNDFLMSFDIENEIDFLVQSYNGYIEYDGNKIILDNDFSLFELDELIREESENYSKDYINYFNNLINNDLDLLSILGIKIKTEIYEKLLNNEKNIEKSYKNLPEEEIKNIKKYHFFNRIMFFNMKSLLDIEEYSDLYLYSIEMANMCKEFINIPMLLESELSGNILDDSFERSLFLIENNYPFILRDKISVNISREMNTFDKSKLNFYLIYLELLDKEISNVKNEKLRSELNINKHRLMNALDSIYDVNTFMGKENIDIGDDDYSFIRDDVFFFINELSKYDDGKYLEDDQNVYIIYFYNIIKKIYIDTYYNLTNDEKVMEMISNNKGLDNSEITSNILSSVGKKKIRSINEN